MRKNKNGALLKRTMDKETRLVNTIDKREADGSNKENTDNVYNNHTINDDGSRSWSF
jgi:hypothetical protein